MNSRSTVAANPVESSVAFHPPSPDLASPASLEKLLALSINPLNRPDWDRLVASLPSQCFFHSTAWARVLVDTYDYHPAYIMRESGGMLQGLLPIMEVDSWISGRRGIALPFTDDSEPWCSNPGTFRSLIESAVELGTARGWNYFECRGGKDFPGDVPSSLAFYGHSIQIVPDEECMFARLESSVRRAIRKSEKEGVSVEISQSLSAVREFYALQCKTRKKHGLPPQPFAFFRNIHQHVLAADKGVIVTARYRGRPIAASVYFHFGQHAIYKYGASDESSRHLRGNNIVMWEAIKWCRRTGMKRLDLGRTSVENVGLRKFKLGWHAEERPIEYWKYDLRSRRFVSDKDRAAGWHTRIFRMMPIPLSRAVGAFLYRHSA